MSALDRLFEAFFKYPLSTFGAGSFRFLPSWPFWIAVASLVLVGGPALVAYWRQERRRRPIVIALRTAALLLVLFCLARPSLVLSIVVPQESFVGVLLDDSASMGINDSDSSRATRMGKVLSPEGADLLGKLGERFKVRQFSFARELRRVSGPQELLFAGNASHLGAALGRAADELAAVPLAGLVVLTDGADNSTSSLDEAILDLKASGVPVYSVGFGRERYERDVQVSRVEAPLRVLEGTSLVVEVTVEQDGFAGESVDLEVMDEGRIVSTETVRFPNTGEAVVTRVSFLATEPGAREFQFRVLPKNGEAVLDNNRRMALIQVDEAREKILYFEGEPRWELKFLRRAVKADENLQLVVLQRTAENRFLRFELDDADELAGGFPVTREELFKYRGLILGSVEASFFTHDQLRMIADFASQRGGGFLMLGGPHSFSEGDWAGTPVADMLPVVLGPSANDEGEPFHTFLDIELTPWGKAHPALRLAEGEEASLELWARLPTVSTFNPVTRLKPGATSLIGATGEGIPGEQVVLAFQRYGRGRSLAWTVQDSWKWQMHADVPVEDMTHETFWRQMLRWLVSYVPSTVEARTDVDIVEPDAPVEIVAEIHDDSFLEINNAQVAAVVTSSSGEQEQVILDWVVEKDGEYRGSFRAGEEGLYRIDVDARAGDRFIGETQIFVKAADHHGEVFDAELRAESLERLSSETGGRYYPPDQASRLVDDMALNQEGSTLLERRELWDMPLVLLFLTLLLVGEWGLRRRAGMA
ncbi:MAG: glutamine amidotransferase [Acidobacteriota bacterium]|nr:glutamine amidotransferase [Acidobacteriota bacterium]